MQPLSLHDDYEQRVAARQLTRDTAQEAILIKLNALKSTLEKAERRWFGKALSPRGLYIYGAVGRGKSMLADLFFSHVSIGKKRRIHFHAFMQDVHARIHLLRKSPNEENPVATVARTVAKEVRLLYLDEFQVQDVADAMILAQFFSVLFAQGVIVLTTSNRMPEDLYQHGLQRESFIRFVKLLREHVEVVALESSEDYRLKQLRALDRTYLAPLGPAAENFLKNIKDQFSASAESQYVLQVHGRSLPVRTLDAKTAIFAFSELCEQPLGAADYLAIAQKFEIVIFTDIPKMSRERRNEAKRFVTLIDTLYEQKVKLIATADAPPHELYPEGDGAFEFERTASRLIEMQSARYLGTSHAG